MLRVARNVRFFALSCLLHTERYVQSRIRTKLECVVRPQSNLTRLVIGKSHAAICTFVYYLSIIYLSRFINWIGSLRFRATRDRERPSHDVPGSRERTRDTRETSYLSAGLLASYLLLQHHTAQIVIVFSMSKPTDRERRRGERSPASRTRSGYLRAHD